MNVLKLIIGPVVTHTKRIPFMVNDKIVRLISCFAQNKNYLEHSPRLRRLKVNVIPSLNLPKRKLDKVIDTPTKEKIRKRSERAQKRSKFVGDLFGASNELDQTQEQTSSDFEELANELINEARVQISNKEPILTFDKCIQVDPLYQPPGFKSTIMDLIRNDSDILAFTGIPTLLKFKKIVEVGELIVFRLNYNTEFVLDVHHRILLTLIKLKLNISYKCLCVLFSISKSTCANYFYNTIDLLYLILKPLIIWPSKNSIENNIPRCFINFMSTRVIVDGTETAIETPKCLACRIRTYSFYKGRHTIKFMVGISPDGLITFVSDVFGGKASDKHIFETGGILNKCEIGDSVMADKGFLIEESCTNAGVKLIRPPFLRKNKQLSLNDGVANTEIAKARVHIERAIQRIKIYHIFKNKMPWKCMCKIDKIVYIVCGITNISNPIIGNDGF